jgi:hypothetical protein
MTPEFVIFPTFASCPACHGPVRGETFADLTVFVCTRCGAWWHVELGMVYRVEDAAHPWPARATATRGHGEDCIDPVPPSGSIF